MSMRIEIDEDPSSTVFYAGDMEYKDITYVFTAVYNTYSTGYSGIDEILWDEEPSKDIKSKAEDRIIKVVLQLISKDKPIKKDETDIIICGCGKPIKDPR